VSATFVTISVNGICSWEISSISAVNLIHPPYRNRRNSKEKQNQEYDDAINLMGNRNLAEELMSSRKDPMHWLSPKQKATRRYIHQEEIPNC